MAINPYKRHHQETNARKIAGFLRSAGLDAHYVREVRTDWDDPIYTQGRHAAEFFAEVNIGRSPETWELVESEMHAFDEAARNGQVIDMFAEREKRSTS